MLIWGPLITRFEEIRGSVHQVSDSDYCGVHQISDLDYFGVHQNSELQEFPFEQLDGLAFHLYQSSDVGVLCFRNM